MNLRIYFIFTLLGLAGFLGLQSSGWTAETQTSAFSSANSKYQDGHFKEAVTLYETALKSRPTLALTYNLGNACFRAGQKGRALLYYRRALAMNPRDADTRWNLQILKGTLPDRLEESSPNLIFSAVRRTTDYLTVDEAALLTTLVLGLLAAVAFVGFIFDGFKFLARPISFFLTICLVIVCTLFVFKWWEAKDPTVIVLDKEVYARSGPSDREAKAFLLHEGAEAKQSDELGNWIYVSLPNKNAGWIPKKSCERV